MKNLTIRLACLALCAAISVPLVALADEGEGPADEAPIVVDQMAEDGSEDADAAVSDQDGDEIPADEVPPADEQTPEEEPADETPVADDLAAEDDEADEVPAADDQMSEEELVDETPAAGDQAVDDEVSDEAPAAEDQAEEAEQQSFRGLEGDSWRFQDGKPKAVEGDGDDLYVFAEHEAWCRDEEGYFRSSDDTRIPGAVRRGVDVSEWNDQPDWERVKEDDVSFAILRCGGSYTVSKKQYDDSEFARNVEECERVGIEWGAYFFSAATTVKEARAEADFTIAQLKGLHPGMPVYLDLEVEEVAAKITPARFTAIAKAWCSKIKAAGYTPGVYASLSWWEQYLTDPVFNKWPRWVAQYYSKCEYEGPYQYWQCTGTGEIDGIEGYSGYVDINFEIDENFIVPDPPEPPEPPAPEEPPFPDVPLTHWAVKDIRRAVALHIIYGYADGTFGPEDNITRAQAATILWRMAGSPPEAEGARDFDDVVEGAYYEPAVRWASSVGIIYGYSGSNNFGPTDNVSRQQLAVMLANYARKVAHVKASGTPEDYASFTDAEDVADWASKAIAWCVNNKVMSGSNGLLLPRGEATRAQAAKMFVKVYDLVS